MLGDGEVMNPEGLRYSDEFARHKALDAVGDLMLAGAPILGAYRSVRGGHRLNCAMVAALMADRDAWTWTESPMRRETAGANVGFTDAGRGIRSGRLLTDRPGHKIA